MKRTNHKFVPGERVIVLCNDKEWPGAVLEDQGDAIWLKLDGLLCTVTFSRDIVLPIDPPLPLDKEALKFLEPGPDPGYLYFG